MYESSFSDELTVFKSSYSFIYGSNICAVIVIVDTEASADQSKT